MPLSSAAQQYADAWDTSVRVDIDGEHVGFFHTEDAGALGSSILQRSSAGMFAHIALRQCTWRHNSPASANCC